MARSKKLCINCKDRGELQIVSIQYKLRDAKSTGSDRHVKTKNPDGGEYITKSTKSYVCKNCGLVQEFVTW